MHANFSYQTVDRRTSFTPLGPPHLSILLNRYRGVGIRSYRLDDVFPFAGLHNIRNYITLVYVICILMYLSTSTLPKESTKTTSMEDVSTGVLAKIKNF